MTLNDQYYDEHIRHVPLSRGYYGDEKDGTVVLRLPANDMSGYQTLGGTIRLLGPQNGIARREIVFDNESFLALEREVKEIAKILRKRKRVHNARRRALGA